MREDTNDRLRLRIVGKSIFFKHRAFQEREQIIHSNMPHTFLQHLQRNTEYHIIFHRLILQNRIGFELFAHQFLQLIPSPHPPLLPSYIIKAKLSSGRTKYFLNVRRNAVFTECFCELMKLSSNVEIATSTSQSSTCSLRLSVFFSLSYRKCIRACASAMRIMLSM